MAELVSGTSNERSARDDRNEDRNEDPRIRASRDEAFRVLERHAEDNSVDHGTATGDALTRDERVIRADRTGGAARYIAAVGDPHYATAFEKMLRDPTTAHLRFSPQEVEAVRIVMTAQEEQRDLLTTTTGVPIPFALDPSLVITGSGALNPVRQTARVEVASEGTWKTAATAEVAASYDAEGSEVSDDTPAMTQPTIVTARGTAFVPFSIEAGQDWGSLINELGPLLQDSRDVLDAVQFLTGSGSSAPGGILNIGATGGLTTTQRVLSAGAGAIAIGDVYALKQALPARFLGDGAFFMHPTRADGVFRLVASGSTAEPQIFPDGRGGPLLGKPLYEWSAMATAVATGSKWAIFANMSKAYAVVDRLGFTIELLPLLVGASRRPTGERGFFAYWRTGAGVIAANAARYGETS
jgi:HK97 family phage major capsid protein